MTPANEDELLDIVSALQAATTTRNRLKVDVAIMGDLSVKPLSDVKWLEEGEPVEIIKHH